MENSISVIVPIFNEEQYLLDSVTRLINVEIFKEIILVDDGSTDKSNIIAKKLSNDNKNIDLITIPNQFGKGNAIKEGLTKVTSSHVIVHDADLEYFPSDIIEMFKVANQNQNVLVLGSRSLKGKPRINRYKLTFYTNKLFTYFFSFVNFYKVSDIASCYWLVETDTVRKFDLKEKGFAIEVEVLSKFLKLHSCIIEIPIKYEGRLYSEGKKIKVKDGFQIFLKIIKYSKLNIFLKF